MLSTLFASSKQLDAVIKKQNASFTFSNNNQETKNLVVKGA